MTRFSRTFMLCTVVIFIVVFEWLYFPKLAHISIANFGQSPRYEAANVGQGGFKFEATEAGPGRGKAKPSTGTRLGAWSDGRTTAIPQRFPSVAAHTAKSSSPNHQVQVDLLGRVGEKWKAPTAKDTASSPRLAVTRLSAKPNTSVQIRQGGEEGRARPGSTQGVNSSRPIKYQASKQPGSLEEAVTPAISALQASASNGKAINDQVSRATASSVQKNIAKTHNDQASALGVVQGSPKEIAQQKQLKASNPVPDKTELTDLAMADIFEQLIPTQEDGLLGIEALRKAIKKRLMQNSSSLSGHPGPFVIWSGESHVGTQMEIVSSVVARGWTAVISGALPLNQNNPYQPDMSQVIVAKHYKPLPRMLSSPQFWYVPPDDEKNLRELFEHYRNDPILQSVDAFICALPATLCEAFLPFNKTVIFAPAHRFAVRKCTKKTWRNSIEIMKRAVKSENPRHFVAAMSRYDSEYINYFTGLKPLPMYSSSRAYLPRNTYKPSRPEILIGPLHLPFLMVWDRDGYVPQEHVFMSPNSSHSLKFVTALQLYNKGNGYTFEQVMQHRAVVVLPYAVMSYGMTELYELAIPMFVPSVKWMKERPLYYPNDRTVTQYKSHYCEGNGSIVPDKDPASDHPYSPESLEDDAKYYWLQFADFYQWPHVQFFDTVDDLVEKLSTLDLASLHKKMVRENERRFKQFDKAWETIARGISHVPRQTPTKFHPIDDFLGKL